MKTEKCIITLVALIFCLISACSSNVGMEKDEMPLQASIQEPKFQPYKIQPGDELDIKFFYNPELNEVVTVRPDGMISLQLVDEIKVVGLETAELDNILTEKYSKELRKPVLTVIVRTFSGQRVFVGGEVIRPGLITLAPGMHPVQAIFQAGGFRETASPDDAVIIRKGKDNKPIPILLDLTEALSGKGEAANFALQPDDIIYVPKTAIAQVNKFVDEYIQGLLMFRGWSFGIGYEIYKD